MTERFCFSEDPWWRRRVLAIVEAHRIISISYTVGSELMAHPWCASDAGRKDIASERGGRGS